MYILLKAHCLWLKALLKRHTDRDAVLELGVHLCHSVPLQCSLLYHPDVHFGHRLGSYPDYLAGRLRRFGKPALHVLAILLGLACVALIVLPLVFHFVDHPFCSHHLFSYES